MIEVLPFVWGILGIATIVAGVRSRRSARAMYAGRWILSMLYVGAGALVNLVFLLTGSDYADFAESSFIPFVRDTWRSLVVPNVEIFIPILIAFEAAVGVMVLLGRRWTQLALVAMIGFHFGLMTFGFGFFIWALPMIGALAVLLRAERRASSASGHVATSYSRAA